MTNVTNLRRDRAVKVRDGDQKIVTIQVGETRDVPDFDTKRPFHADLIKERSIEVGKGGQKALENSESRGDDLKRELADAQTLFKQAKDALIKAGKDLKDDPENGELKKAKSVAQSTYKEAEEALADAQDAFDKG